VPMVAKIEPPSELFAVDRNKLVGLSVDPDRLLTYRRRRQRDLGPNASTSYSDPREITRDLEHADRLFRTRRIAAVDVTSRPIEETANEVMALVGRRRPDVR